MLGGHRAYFDIPMSWLSGDCPISECDPPGFANNLESGISGLEVRFYSWPVLQQPFEVSSDFQRGVVYLTFLYLFYMYQISKPDLTNPCIILPYLFNWGNGGFNDECKNLNNWQTRGGSYIHIEHIVPEEPPLVGWATYCSLEEGRCVKGSNMCTNCPDDPFVGSCNKGGCP
jgi:hypothetical protein